LTDDFSNLSNTHSVGMLNDAFHSVSMHEGMLDARYLRRSLRLWRHRRRLLALRIDVGGIVFKLRPLLEEWR
jgi:hypothetical protein